MHEESFGVLGTNYREMNEKLVRYPKKAQRLSCRERDDQQL